jgi:hypothetical protein
MTILNFGVFKLVRPILSKGEIRIGNINRGGKVELLDNWRIRFGLE